jgi:lipopolysaccharide transport system permease protein
VKYLRRGLHRPGPAPRGGGRRLGRESHGSTSARPHLVLSPRGRWSAARPTEIWEFRDLLRSFAARDIRLRYRQTALGAIWVVLQPLLPALLFTLVFGRIADLPSDGVPYVVFAFSGQLAWQVFNGVVTRGVNSVVGSAGMVSKIYFPRLILPMSVAGAVLLDFLVGLVVMTGFLIAYGISPSAGLVLLPMWLAFILLLALGIGFVAAGLAVRFRDVQFVVPMAMQLLLFGSPVAYSLDSVPESLRFIYDLNPLSGLLEGFRWSLIGTSDLSLAATAYAAGSTLVLFAVGIFVFSSLERDFADVI